MRHRAHRRRGRNGVVDHERHGRPVDHRCSTGYRSHREVIAAVDATLAAPSFTLSTDAKLTTGTLQSRLIASGSIDFPQLIADMTISVESGNQKGESETRANGTTVWVRADNDGVNELDLPDGKRWVEGGTEQLTEVQIFQQGTRGLLGVLLTLRAAEATETIGTDNLDDYILGGRSLGSFVTALSAGASTFLWQSWGPAKVDLENIESWAGVPGGLTGHQIYPTESTRNAKRRDNRFWLVPVGPSRFVVGVSAPEGAHAAELAQAVAASIGAGPCP